MCVKGAADISFSIKIEAHIMHPQPKKLQAKAVAARLVAPSYGMLLSEELHRKQSRDVR